MVQTAHSGCHPLHLFAVKFILLSVLMMVSFNRILLYPQLIITSQINGNKQTTKDLENTYLLEYIRAFIKVDHGKEQFVGELLRVSPRIGHNGKFITGLSVIKI